MARKKHIDHALARRKEMAAERKAGREPRVYTARDDSFARRLAEGFKMMRRTGQ